MKLHKKPHTLESHDYPPNWNEIKDHFPELAGRCVFTWGPVIFNPKGKVLDPGTIRHENFHSTQQFEYGGNKWRYKISTKQRYVDWWERYLKDEAFRFAQEIPAYQVQYWEYENQVTDKKKLKELCTLLAKELSSGFYGKRISISKAVELLKSQNLVQFNV